MGKKIIGILFVGLLIALVIPVGTADADFDCKLSAFGIIRIDSTNSEIKGFVLFGNNDGQDLRFTVINIKFDDGNAPVELVSKMPLLLHTIKYNPVK
jgi:hypothetical protein